MSPADGQPGFTLEQALASNFARGVLWGECVSDTCDAAISANVHVAIAGAARREVFLKHLASRGWVVWGRPGDQVIVCPACWKANKTKLIMVIGSRHPQREEAKADLKAMLDAERSMKQRLMLVLEVVQA